MMTSKQNRLKDKYTFSLPENPNGVVILKHTKFLSSKRFLNTLMINGEEVRLSEDSMRNIFIQYFKYLCDIENSSEKAIDMYRKSRSKTIANDRYSSCDSSNDKFILNEHNDFVVN